MARVSNFDIKPLIYLYRLRLNDSDATPSAAIQHSARDRAKGSNQPESVLY
jgi:hypothetical protein